MNVFASLQMSSAPGYIRKAWYKWKALRLPWRRRFFVGTDLAGNTFWEFKDALHSNRYRRIVKYSRKTHYGDVKISPQWLQWLRHTRPLAPSIQEQQYEISRQALMKQLAAQADERWRSAPSFLDSPARQQPHPATGSNEPYADVTMTDGGINKGDPSVMGNQAGVKDFTEGMDSSTDQGRHKEKARTTDEAPWAKNIRKGAPGEIWQPESWSPGVLSRR